MKFNPYKFLGGNAMKNISTIRIILPMSFSLLFCCNIYTQVNGDTRVAEWKDNKQAAISMGFDDSSPTHLDNAIPVLEAKGLPAVFYVNPGKSYHIARNDEWLNILNRGQHLAPHTMNHRGSVSYDDAVYEIGAAAEYVWDAYGVPYHSELLSYASGGGVTWNGLTRQERLDIDDSYNLINRYHYHICSTCSDPDHWHSERLPHSVNMSNYSTSTIINKIDDNTADGTWEHFYGHGVGSGYSITMQKFEAVTDYMQSIQDEVWVVAYINAFKYDMERFSAEVEVLENTSEIIKLRLSSDISASGFITNDVNLYNEPLTLITQVRWTDVTVTQGNSSKTYTANNGEVMYEALPNVGTTNRGDIILQESDVLPVELTSFTASVKNSSVTLNWETVTEVNNYGFEIEKQIVSKQSVVDNWQWIGFVEGHGNSSSTKQYSFTDKNPLGGSVFIYRLKQIDNDGKFEYSDEIEVEIIPSEFALYQNYPNPFNPATTIRYQLPQESKVIIKLYDILGSEVLTLLNEKKEPGVYEVEFNATQLSSGTYIYRMISDDFVETKKMVLMK